MSQKYSGDDSQNNTVLKRMFEEYQKHELNEYGKTMIFEKMQNVRKGKRFDQNQKGGLKIIDHSDKQHLRKGTYLNTLKDKNKTRINEAMSGMEDLNDIVHLQVIGKSQITKELEELTKIPKKYYIKNAFHRNEKTREIEPEEGYKVDEV